MLLRRVLLHVRNQSWLAVLLDLCVVVLGLFIGLQVDSWWQDQRDADHQSAYLVEIREDFESNRQRLTGSVAWLERILRDISVLYEQATLENPTIPTSELNDRFRSITAMPAFIPVNRTYSNLTGSGDLKLIQSRPLKNALAIYYAAAELTLLVQSTHEMELVSIYEPYIIENLDYAAVLQLHVDDLSPPAPVDASAIVDVLKTRCFRNVLTQKWVIATDLLSQHRGMADRTAAIIRQLDNDRGL